jgi:hypothetical protein
MAPIDSRFKRIARRLTTFELVVDDVELGESGLLEGGLSSRTGERFLGYYSPAGIRRVLQAYGVTEALDDLGLGPVDVVLTSDDAYRHRLQVVLNGVRDDDHRLIDLVMSLRRARQSDLLGRDGASPAHDMVMVEWLCLQNPRASFSHARPRLPGQRYPGLGLGRTFHNLTLLMARRLGRDGVINVPEHYHLAVIYDRAGYSFVAPAHRAEVGAVRRATRRCHLATAAWAADRGFIRRGSAHEGGSVGSWTYRPAEMVAPVSARLEHAMRARERRRGSDGGPEPTVELDLEGLRDSLRRDPVEGIDPDDLLIGPG